VERYLWQGPIRISGSIVGRDRDIHHHDKTANDCVLQSVPQALKRTPCKRCQHLCSCTLPFSCRVWMMVDSQSPPDQVSEDDGGVAA